MTSSSRDRSVLIETARLRWQDSGEPVSELFDDCYFSASGGLSESRHVFIEHNDLPRRFQQLGPAETFTLAETGFGTGLNFLATVDLWCASDTDGWLHFVSFERYPLTLDDLGKALRRWPELADYTAMLCAQYPPPMAGVHRLHWPQQRIRLTLYFGDAQAGLDALPFTAQAWYLDGFDPRSNSGLWNDALYLAIAAHSRAGTTFATYTVAGNVRRGLAAAGFQLQRVPGHTPKREMLRGALATAPTGPELPGTSRPKPARVIVIGAGIAGCLVASNLARRGCRVTLVEAGAGPGNGASGNRQGALYVKLGVDYNGQSELALAALIYAQRYYTVMQDTVMQDYSNTLNNLNNAPEQSPFWHPTGLLQLATTTAESDRQQRFLARHAYPDSVLAAVSAAAATDLAGLTIEHPGLYFPASGWLAPAQLCQALAAQPGIELLNHTRLQAFGQANGGHWVEVINERGDTAVPERLLCDQLVLCPGASSLLTDLQIPARQIRGQISWWPQQLLPAPDCVICGEGYINPSDGESITIGATFDLRDNDPGVREEDHGRNLQAVGHWLGAIGALAEDKAVLGQANGRTGFRCTTPDYQPLAGLLHPAHDLPATTVALATNEASEPAVAVLAGLGSKGLAYAPLLAEWLCDRICGEAAALPLSLAELVHPQRFTVRRAINADKHGNGPT